MANLYDTDYFRNYNNQLPNTQNNSGLAWWMNANQGRYPSPVMPGMLDQTGQMGAYTNTPQYRSETEKFKTRFDPTELQAAPENKGFNFPSIWSGVKGGLEWLGDKFQLPEAKQRAYESIMDTGTYKGNPYTLYDTPSGLKIGSDIIGYGQGYAKNFDSMFGSKSIEDMEQKKVDWALGRLDKFKDDEENLGISKRLYNALIKRGIIDSSGNRITTPAGADTVTTTTTTGGSTTPNVHGGGSEASFTQRSPGGISQAVSRAARTDQRGNVMKGWNLAEGGRAGYREGELVDEDVNIQGPGFDVNENVMMASNEWNERLLENLFEKYLDLGFSPVEAEKLALEEFESMSQAPQEEVVEEGIASLV